MRSPFLVFSLALFLACWSEQCLAQDDGKAIGLAPQTTTTAGGQRWALVIGINDYINVSDLKYARQDAQALAKVLTEQAGFPNDNVMVMTDQAPGRSPMFPTRGNIYARITQFAATAKKNDVLLILFSGHGTNVDGHGYLVPIDGTMDEVGSLVPLSWVRKTIETSAARLRLLILDACHAGAKGDGRGPALNAVAGAAFLTMASSESSQLSHEDPDRGHGVFTAALMEGMAGHADQHAEGNKDGVVTADELFHYASLRTRQWGIRHGKTQTPVKEGRVSGRVELARFIPRPDRPPMPPLIPDPRPAPDNSLKPFQAITNSLGMKLVLIPAGEYQRGSRLTPEQVHARLGGNVEWYNREHPRHTVTISRPFFIASTEVTRGQFARFVKETGHQTDAERRGKGRGYVDGEWGEHEDLDWRTPGFLDDFTQTDDHPVVSVSWNDAVVFCKWLSKKEGRDYRLPTEAEWEYAARAGSDSLFSFGDEPVQGRGHLNGADETWGLRFNDGTDRWPFADGYKNTAPVGSFKANRWGLHDMHGNVWEWCSDWYGDYPKGSVTDPSGPATGKYRVLRGGSWNNHPANCRSANRNRNTPDNTNTNNGFRVVCSPRALSAPGRCSPMARNRGVHRRLRDMDPGDFEDLIGLLLGELGFDEVEEGTSLYV